MSDGPFRYKATPGAMCCGLAMSTGAGTFAAYCNGCGWAGPIRASLTDAALDALEHGDDNE